MRAALLVLAALPAAMAAADGLTVVKATQVVSDGVSTLNPKALPGARIDYRLTVTNPAGNLGATVASEAVSDTIDPSVKLSVIDLGGGGSGPVAFEDGGATGVVSSGLGYRYGGLASMTDGLEFYDGASWSYVPVADADGCDARVRGVRVRLTGTHIAASSFRLRYRVVVR